MMLTLKEVAAELRVSQQWLKYWLVANPLDEAGVPFYVRMSSRLKFQQQDIDRMIAHMRKLETTRLGLSGQSKAQLVGLLAKLDGLSVDEMLQKRAEERKRREAEERGPRPARARLPRFKRANGILP